MEINPYDVLVVGAGPGGLAAAGYAAHCEKRVLILDALEFPGGQVALLYPEKKVSDLLEYPYPLGKEYIARLAEYAKRNGATIALGERAERLERLSEKLFCIITTKSRHYAKSVLIASGIGPCKIKRLPDDAVNAFEGRGLSYYRFDMRECRGRSVLVVGGGTSAVEYAPMMLEKGGARSVTLIHRRDEFRGDAEPYLPALARSAVVVLTSTELKSVIGNTRVKGAVVANTQTGEARTFAVSRIFAFLGYEKELGPLKEWGLALRGKAIVSGARYETNIPGVFAIGECTYREHRVPLDKVWEAEGIHAASFACAFVTGGKAFQGWSTVKEKKKERGQR